jgi:sarcosine oxidase
VRRFEVIVVGLGGMGSAALAHAAARGKRALGIEQFQAAHPQGSSHGRSRVIRLAYFEHPDYVPLLRRAYELWRRLETLTGRDLLHITGGLMIGSPCSEVVSGSLRSARQHDLEHEMLDAGQLRSRFPALMPAPGTVALYEKAAGIVFPEEAIRAHLDVASDNGAQTYFGVRVEDWDASAAGTLRVETTHGRFETTGSRAGAVGGGDLQAGAAARSRAAAAALVCACRRPGPVRGGSISDLHLGPRQRRAVLRISRG